MTTVRALLMAIARRLVPRSTPQPTRYPIFTGPGPLDSFETAVLLALVEGDPEESNLREQLLGATVRTREYTGVGLYTELAVAADAPRVGSTRRWSEPARHVLIHHPAMAYDGGAVLWFADGLLGTLECFTHGTESWPEQQDAELLTIERWG